MKQAMAFARTALRVDTIAAYKAQHSYDPVYTSLRDRLRESHGTSMQDLRVLDWGCGYFYPNLIFLGQDVKEMVGIDVYPVYRDGWQTLVRWSGGLRKPKATALALLEYVHAARYYRQLQRSYGIRAEHDRYQIVKYDGQRMPLEDGSFDCAVSNAVLQEVSGPLEECARELARVLKPGGTLDLEWHNFYAWSGHVLGEEYGRRSPWGHLLGGPYRPCLNRLKPEEALEAFSPWFTDLRLLAHDRHHRVSGKDPAFEPEGEEYLTPELQERLSQYPRELLLTRGFVLQGRRK